LVHQISELPFPAWITDKSINNAISGY